MTRRLDEAVQRIRDWFAGRHDSRSELLGWLELESGSSDKAGVDGFGRAVAEAFARLGGEVESHPHDRYGEARSISFAGRGRVVLLGHLDTVWPRGTAARWPSSHRDGWLSGPGVLDMKGGIFVALEAVRCLRELELVAPRLEVLLTSDEEIGSPWGAELIARRVKGADACLVLEPGLDGGRLKTTRCGVAYYELCVHGSGGHPGHREAGDTNAVVELATLLPKVIGAASGNGLHVEPTRQVADVPLNVIPAEASVTLDVRFTRGQDLSSFEAGVEGLLSAARRGDAGGTLREVRARRPPLESTERNRWLAGVVFRAAELLEQEIDHGVTAGASDAGFVAEQQVPVVDGLGPWGTGMHALHEAVAVDALTQRGALLAASLMLLAAELE